MNKIDIIFPKTTSEQFDEQYQKVITQYRKEHQSEYDALKSSKTYKLCEKYNPDFDTPISYLVFGWCAAVYALAHFIIATICFKGDNPHMHLLVIAGVILVALGVFTYFYIRNATTYAWAQTEFIKLRQQTVEACGQLLEKHIDADTVFEENIPDLKLQSNWQSVIDNLNDIRSDATDVTYSVRYENRQFIITRVINDIPFDSISIHCSNPERFRKITKEQGVLDFSYIDEIFAERQKRFGFAN